MKKTSILAAVFLSAIFGKVQAQTDTNVSSHTLGITIPSVAIVDIEPTAAKNITMAFTAPTEAGLPIVAPANNSTLWLNYSYIPTTSTKTAKVSVKVDAVVPGLDVKVQAAAASGTGGGGTVGTSVAAPVTLTTADQPIVSAIGASYTGDLNVNGHNLTYSLSASNYPGLFASTPSLTVTYTISEN